MSSNQQKGSDSADAEMTHQEAWSQEAVVASPQTPPTALEVALENVDALNLENSGGPSAQVADFQNDSQNPDEDCEESEEEGEFYAMTLRTDGTLVGHDPRHWRLRSVSRPCLLLAGTVLNNGATHSSTEQAEPSQPEPKRTHKAKTSKPKKEKKKKKKQ